MKSIKPAKIKAVHLIIIAVLVVALAAVMIIIFVPRPPDAASDSTGSETNIPAFAIETPYCILKYPEQWKDQIAVEETADEGCLSETFYALIADGKYKLFTIYFGNSLAGNLFGYLPDNEAAVPVYIECHSLPEEIEPTKSDITLFNSMMESINTVVESISETPGYSEP